MTGAVNSEPRLCQPARLPSGLGVRARPRTTRRGVKLNAAWQETRPRFRAGPKRRQGAEAHARGPPAQSAAGGSRAPEPLAHGVARRPRAGAASPRPPPPPPHPCFGQAHFKPGRFCGPRAEAGRRKPRAASDAGRLSAVVGRRRVHLSTRPGAAWVSSPGAGGAGTQPARRRGPLAVRPSGDEAGPPPGTRPVCTSGQERPGLMASSEPVREGLLFPPEA